MSPKTLARIATVLFLSLPGTAAAYLTPEQVLEIDANRSIWPLPINERLSRALIKRQDERQKLLHPVRFNEGTESDPVEPAVTQADDDTPRVVAKPAAPAKEENDDTFTLDTRTVRLLARLQSRDSAGNAIGGPLHTGAPLAPTGPEGMATVLVMIGSIGYVVWKSKRMENGRIH